jgi:hypothetical protein
MELVDSFSPLSPRIGIACHAIPYKLAGEEQETNE